MNVLDRPIWAALATRQREFAQGGPLALRYRPNIEPFAAVGEDNEVSLEALAALAVPDDFLLLIQTTPSPVPTGLELVNEAVGVQMVAAREIEGDRPEDAVVLGDVDVAEMVALAELTRPGPFRVETHRLGQFWGIRREGALVAMAGERMKLAGMSEVSGVCTHPDWRGQGFARKLSAFVASQIQKSGETPFLHAYADNAAAIDLYRRLGFVIRTEMAVQVLQLAE